MSAPEISEAYRSLARSESNDQTRTKGILYEAGTSSPIGNEPGRIEGVWLHDDQEDHSSLPRPLNSVMKLSVPW